MNDKEGTSVRLFPGRPKKFAVVAFACLVVAGMLVSACETAPPPPPTPAEAARSQAVWTQLVGTAWSGEFDNGLPVTLTIRDAGAWGVYAYYEWGERFVGRRLFPSGSRGITGQFLADPNALRFTWRNRGGNSRELNATHDPKTRFLSLRLTGPNVWTAAKLSPVDAAR
jgi:hypothetical protein